MARKSLYVLLVLIFSLGTFTGAEAQSTSENLSLLRPGLSPGLFVLRGRRPRRPLQGRLRGLPCASSMPGESPRPRDATGSLRCSKKKHRRHRYSGPAPTHPVVLWARTLSESTDREQRKIAAFKLSQYSQPIFQQPVIASIERCLKDSDVEIKVLCGKAMAHAGTQSNADNIRKVLLDTYKADPDLRNTIVRAFIVRRDQTPLVHDTFLEELKSAKPTDDVLTLLSYFEQFGYGNAHFVEVLADIYKKNENLKVRRSVVKALGERSHGQDPVIEILSQCSESKDTPMALNCLSGLQLQAKKDSRAWAAVEKTIESTDPDVLMATLDVINALPESTNVKISNRLVEIIQETDDGDIQEKAVLALGVCGDQSEPVVKVLTKLVEEDDTDDSVRVAAALIMGKQAMGFPEKPTDLLNSCSNKGRSQSLRTACQLGLKELEARKKLQAQAQTPAIIQAPPPVTPAKIEEPPSKEETIGPATDSPKIKIP